MQKATYWQAVVMFRFRRLTYSNKSAIGGPGDAFSATQLEGVGCPAELEGSWEAPSASGPPNVAADAAAEAASGNAARGAVEGAAWGAAGFS